MHISRKEIYIYARTPTPTPTPRPTHIYIYICALSAANQAGANAVKETETTRGF